MLISIVTVMLRHYISTASVDLVVLGLSLHRYAVDVTTAGGCIVTGGSYTTLEHTEHKKVLVYSCTSTDNATTH